MMLSEITDEILQLKREQEEEGKDVVETALGKISNAQLDTVRDIVAVKKGVGQADRMTQLAEAMVPGLSRLDEIERHTQATRLRMYYEFSEIFCDRFATSKSGGVVLDMEAFATMVDTEYRFRARASGSRNAIAPDAASSPTSCVVQ